MNKEKIKKKLIEKWEKIENDVDLVNMIDDIIEDTAKTILEEIVEIEKTFKNLKIKIETSSYFDDIPEAEEVEFWWDEVFDKITRLKKQFGVK